MKKIIFANMNKEHTMADIDEENTDRLYTKALRVGGINIFLLKQFIKRVELKTGNDPSTEIGIYIDKHLLLMPLHSHGVVIAPTGIPNSIPYDVQASMEQEGRL